MGEERDSQQSSSPTEGFSISRLIKHKVGLFLSMATLLIAYQNCAPMSGFEVAQKTSASEGESGSGGEVAPPVAEVPPVPGAPPPTGTPPITQNPPPPGSGYEPGPGGTLPSLPPPVAVGGTVTDIRVQNLSASAQSKVPFTIGHVFPMGALLKTETLAGKLANGNLMNLQVEAKASHPDGSIRHAIISGVLPSIGASATETVSLIKARLSSGTSPAISPQATLNAGFGAVVQANVGGTTYTASAGDALAANQYKTWLSGPYVNEWLVAVPLKTSAGVAHPHLTARFAVRSYAGLNKAKVDVTLENNWAYEPAPQNFTYDVTIAVGGKTVYSKAALMHPTHARWKKTFWWGGEPNAFVKHNTAYIIASRAVPNYDQTIPITETNLASLKTRFSGAAVEPIASGLANRAMASTGGRPDIGLLPAWAVTYLLSMDHRAYVATLGMGDLAGSWSSHFRDKKTDQPISLHDYPYMTVLGNAGDTKNPATGLREAFPACGGVCSNPNSVDVSHQPNFAYLPYLVTGDHYYLEELQFYAMYDSFASNPGYRKNIQGLLAPEQLRGQGWGLRTIADAAYITPDTDRLKTHFMGIVDSNLEWYNATYTNNPDANKLGIIVNGYSIVYRSKAGTAPWQDDFFTQAVGHLVELGFAKALPLLKWKAKFQIGRMTAPGFCWIMGANYTLTVRPNETSPFYSTMAEVYQNSFDDPVLKTLACNSPEMAANLGQKIGDMGGYSSSTEGFPSNYQPALALAVDSGAPDGPKAWQTFMSRTVKPNYGNGPQFSIVPRAKVN